MGMSEICAFVWVWEEGGKEAGLFLIKASEAESVLFQSACTLTSAPSAIPFSLFRRAVEKSLEDKPFPVTLSTLSETVFHLSRRACVRVSRMLWLLCTCFFAFASFQFDFSVVVTCLLLSDWWVI